MKRRRYLASLAGLTMGTGCIGSTATTNQTRSKQMQKSVSVSNVAESGELQSLTFDVEVVDAVITAESTAHVTLKYKNTGENTLTLNINPEEPDPLPSIKDTPGLILLSEIHNPTQASPDCWKPEQESFPQSGVAYNYPIKSGQTTELTYEVWANPQHEVNCIRPGDYEIEPLYGSFTLTVTGN